MEDMRRICAFFEDDAARAMDAIRAAMPRSIITDELISSLGRQLRGEMFDACYRTLIAQYKLIEKKVSYEAFLDSLEQSETRDFLHGRFPGLSAQLAKLSNRRVATALEVFRRFEHDLDDIGRAILGKRATPSLIDCRFGLGDPHRGGRTVAILSLSDGSRVVYKPRKLDIDQAFAEMLTHLGSDVGMTFKVPKVVSKEDYGWAEFISNEPCECEGDVDAYYERLGAMLALLYILEATDFHYENVIAHRSHPVLIDLETFFRPQTPIVGTETNEGIEQSVLRTGILPVRLELESGDTVNIAGSSDVAGQEGLVERMTVERGPDGNPTLIRRKGQLLGGSNVPILDGRKRPLNESCSLQLEAGFARMYREILTKRAEIGRRLSVFLGAQIRVLFRHTLTYTHLLDEGRHPVNLLSEQARERHFSSLNKLSRDFGLGTVLAPHEIRHLASGDVPMFTCPVGSRDLVVDDDTVLTDFFVRDGMTLVRERLDAMSEADLAQQLWLIRESLGITDANVQKQLTMATPSVERVQYEPSDLDLGRRLLDISDSITTAIRHRVYSDDAEARWLVSKALSEDGRTVGISGAFYDLSGGMPGEILFLSARGTALGIGADVDLAMKAYNHLRRRLDEARYSIRCLGVLGGWGSVILSQVALSAMLSEDRFLKEAEALIQSLDLNELIRVDRNFSVAKGAAGFILACVELYLATGSRTSLQAAESCFAHLKRNRVPHGIGYSWRIASRNPLSGLSHGASGFGMAFAKMHAATGMDALAEAVQGCLAFERSLFVPDAGNWRDLRDYTLRTQGPDCGCSWAHGAPGVGIARLAMIEAGFDGNDIRDDLEHAMTTTLNSRSAEDLSVLSGEFGRLELPLLYAEQIDDRHLEATLTRIADVVSIQDKLGRERGNAWLNRSGLMTGATGCAYQALRMTRSVPSIVGFSMQQSVFHSKLSPSRHASMQEIGSNRQAA